ncbi:hypothetical protein BVK86_04615 [Pseudomonas reinekei]|jgi:hypothetical protein|uniref:Uncharacterized protein n=1 Tax=Pseudomonas reinekei TaxID=395598 RepID=A0A1Q9X3H0_PSERE|nr:hypothetical protein BVK86_04615 [Pseudomonas reinekei]
MPASNIADRAKTAFTDLPADSPLFDQAEIVVSNGWMKSASAFEANKPVTREEWVEAARVLVAQGRVKTVMPETHKGTTVRRDEVAELIARAYALGH